MKQLAEVGPDVICSAPDSRRGSYADLCGITGYGQLIAEDIA
jgi:hypothetical protein